jgi:hypothetical protein
MDTECARQLPQRKAEGIPISRHPTLQWCLSMLQRNRGSNAAGVPVPRLARRRESGAQAFACRHHSGPVADRGMSEDVLLRYDEGMDLRNILARFKQLATLA